MYIYNFCTGETYEAHEAHEANKAIRSELVFAFTPVHGDMFSYVSSNRYDGNIDNQDWARGSGLIIHITIVHSIP